MTEATDAVRETMLINLREWLLEMEAKAESDGDPVSIEGFTDEHGVPLGGLVLIRTSEAFQALSAFAEANGYLTQARGSSMVPVLRHGSKHIEARP